MQISSFVPTGILFRPSKRSAVGGRRSAVGGRWLALEVVSRAPKGLQREDCLPKRIPVGAKEESAEVTHFVVTSRGSNKTFVLVKSKL